MPVKCTFYNLSRRKQVITCGVFQISDYRFNCQAYAGDETVLEVIARRFSLWMWTRKFCEFQVRIGTSLFNENFTPWIPPTARPSARYAGSLLALWDIKVMNKNRKRLIGSWCVKRSLSRSTSKQMIQALQHSITNLNWYLIGTVKKLQKTLIKLLKTSQILSHCRQCHNCSLCKCTWNLKIITKWWRLNRF